MSARRRAGEPETPRGPAGAPADPYPPAGTPRAEAASGSDPGRRQTRSVPDPDAADRKQPLGSDTAPAGQPVEEEERVGRELDELVEDLRRERDQYLDLAQRARADFENYRRRAARDSQEAERRGKAGLARGLVPVLDNLERALRAAGIDPEAEAETEDAGGDGGGLAHGVRLVFRELRSTLESAGVETYDPLGERFDPAWHEALSTRAVADTEAGVVVETVEKGYRLDGLLLRAARVIVSAESPAGDRRAGDEG